MYVYFMLCKAKRPIIKIGKSKDPQARLEHLQTGNPWPLEIVWKIECRSEKHSIYIEQSLHRYCKPWRARGEWFYYDKVKQLIGMIQRKEIDPNILFSTQHKKQLALKLKCPPGKWDDRAPSNRICIFD